MCNFRDYQWGDRAKRDQSYPRKWFRQVGISYLFVESPWDLGHKHSICNTKFTRKFKLVYLLNHLRMNPSNPVCGRRKWKCVECARCSRRCGTLIHRCRFGWLELWLLGALRAVGHLIWRKFRNYYSIRCWKTSFEDFGAANWDMNNNWWESAKSLELNVFFFCRDDRQFCLSFFSST